MAQPSGLFDRTLDGVNRNEQEGQDPLSTNELKQRPLPVCMDIEMATEWAHLGGD